MNPSPASDEPFLNRSVEATIRIGVVLLLVAACIRIVWPFLIPIAWGVIVAVALAPSFGRLVRRLGGHNGWAAVVVVLLLLFLLLVPSVMLTGTLVESARSLSTHLQQGSLHIPPPPPGVAGWPLIGESLSQFWTLASTNLEAALSQVGPQLKALGSWLLAAAAGAGFSILQFLLAIVIAGLLLYRVEQGGRVAQAVARRVAGPRGGELADLSEMVVRSVARGILGVALIQAVLAGLGFLAVGVPGAGLWALLCLILSTVQIGVLPVTVPMVFYVFSTSDTLTAVLFLAWMLVVSVIDNILKPILLGRGVQVPMVVIFIGAIGGFLAAGIIGLFVGAVLLVLGYRLFLAWLEVDTPAPPAAAGPEEKPPTV
jgi:predicted PurR-regulated permease PerM